jgi:uncharacterized protein
LNVYDYLVERKRTISFFQIAVLVLPAAWVFVVLGLSASYVQRLLHPGCPAQGMTPDGYSSVTVTSADGLAVRAWWRPAKNGVVVVFLGGHGAGRNSMLPEADLLARHGYGVLSTEPRACAGRLATMGALEAEEVQAAVLYARAQDDVRKVAIMGFSAGGVAAILAAAELPEIDAVIAQGNYYNMWGEIANSGAPPLSLEWQIEHAVCLVIWLRTGIWPPDVSPIRALPDIRPRPVLLVHGEREAQNNRAQAQLEAAGPPNELWIVPGTGHGGYYQAAPDEFERRILYFLEQAFPAAQP